MLFKKLKQHFLAAMPVIGAHNHIETELLLAGIKPIGSYTIENQALLEFTPDMARQRQDLEKLDQAVANGQLIAIDTAPQEFIDFRNQTMSAFERYYGQIDQKENIMDIVNHENDRANSPLKKDFGLYIGYKKRDVLTYRVLENLPSSIASSIEKLLAPAYQARAEKLLEQAGIDDAKQYLEKANTFQGMPERPEILQQPN